MLSSQCFENPPNLSLTCGAGRVEELAGLNTYVTGPSDSKRAVLFIADAFGYEAPKLRKLADKVASAGFLVVVPDFYYGDPVIDVSDPNFNREAWLKAHSPDKGYEDAKPVIAALKSKGVSSIGAAGFCWGGMVLVKLAGTEDIQAAVILHPGCMTEDEIKDLVLGTGGFGDKYDVLTKKFMNSVRESANATNSDEETHYASAVKIPTAILGAENDHIFSAAELKKLGEIMSAKTEIESYVKIFPGVGHGWSVRYNEGNEFAVKSAGEAQEDMLNWFLKHVK